MLVSGTAIISVKYNCAESNPNIGQFMPRKTSAAPPSFFNQCRF
jgi:hypothetical protein